jgi:hypothetical protein
MPAHPSGKGMISVDLTFGGGEGKMKCGARRELSRVLLHSLVILDFVISFGRSALRGILMLTLGATIRRNFDVKIGRAA